MGYIKYSKEMLKDAVNNSVSYRDVLRFFSLKLSGGTQCHIKNRIEAYNIDTSHFTGSGHNKGKISSKRKTANEILVILDEGSYRTKTHQLVRAMLEYGIEYECKKCGNIGKWMGKKLTLHVDHIDGDFLNNIIENLRFLCLNCHSQTKTFGRSKKS